MPSRDTDPVTDPSRENTPELHINDFMTNDGSSELSSMYEADLSSHAASVAWPRRPLDIEEYRPPSVYSFHESPIVLKHCISAVDGYLVCASMALSKQQLTKLQVSGQSWTNVQHQERILLLTSGQYYTSNSIALSADNGSGVLDE
ncbi:hypothetical protein FRC03_003889 [Tulasnella sp. 419]|nr:hypothetical protein FRC03_003889 [Tulasnella sp. 419]